MLTVFVFDERESRQVEDVRSALDRLGEKALLWLALRDPTEEEVAAVQEVFEPSHEQAHRLLEQPSRSSSPDAGEHLHVTLYVASGEGGEPVLRPVECVPGRNWVVTAHEAEIEVLEEFRERAEGGGQIGQLYTPSFVAAVVDWVVTSYFRAFEEVERELEELDAKVMSDTPKNVADELARLVELRRSIGTLRRALSPHREVIVALGHPELDLLPTESSAQRFANLESRVAQAVESAREAKESTRGSFDLLVARIGQRTNDIVKLLTLVTVILLPASVLAGVMGMNFKIGLFDWVWMFWAVIGAMLGIAVLVLELPATETGSSPVPTGVPQQIAASVGLRGIGASSMSAAARPARPSCPAKPARETSSGGSESLAQCVRVHAGTCPRWGPPHSPHKVGTHPVALAYATVDAGG